MSVVLQPAARQLFNSYRADIARANGVESAKETFAVLPAPTQKIIQAYQQQADFLKLINIWPVDNGKGEKISQYWYKHRRQYQYQCSTTSTHCGRQFGFIG
ncbi:MAG: P2 family phage major capsid protein [Acinetobacter sp.]